MLRDADGYKVQLTADYSNLRVEYSEAQENEEIRVTSVPVKIEISPSGSSLAMLIEGDVRSEAVENMEGELREQDSPYFFPTTSKCGKVGADWEKIAFSPVMEELDENLQETFADWLADFEVDHDLFNYILDVSTEKEGDLYTQWLKNFQKIVEGKKM